MLYNPTALRRHRFTVVVLILYLLLLIIPWVFTVILKYRPLGTGAAYDAQCVNLLTPKDVSMLSDGNDTLAFLHGAQAVLALPVSRS